MPISRNTEAYVDSLFADSPVVALRHQRPDLTTPRGERWETSWHTSQTDLLAEARQRHQVGNLFTTINHIPESSSLPDHPTQEPFIRYERLFIDLDPDRPSGIPSSDAELKLANDVATSVAQFLAAYSWPPPARCISGNGAHLMYRIVPLVKSEETSKLLKVIYSTIRDSCAIPGVSIDISVRTINRTAPLYGSIKRKGQPTDDRPHRQSHIRMPSDWRQVPSRDINRIYERHKAEYEWRRRIEMKQQFKRFQEVTGRQIGDFRTLDIVSLFQDQGHYLKDLGKGKHGVVCPWENEHSTPRSWIGETVIFESDGSRWPQFICPRAHCVDRRILQIIGLWDSSHKYCSRAWDARGNINMSHRCD